MVLMADKRQSKQKTALVSGCVQNVSKDSASSLLASWLARRWLDSGEWEMMVHVYHPILIFAGRFFVVDKDCKGLRIDSLDSQAPCSRVQSQSLLCSRPGRAFARVESVVFVDAPPTAPTFTASGFL
ncbi:MAG TPA: hypothetical protein VEN79_05700 [Terriglobia bacterium]|nr:hypothetical protein [Terriglobia bacterium]